MTRNPDSPKRCSYIIKGKYCSEKTIIEDDENGIPKVFYVECPFENKWIKDEIENE